MVRIYPFFADARERSDKPGFVVNQVYQWGQLCASAVTSAYLFADPDHWERHQHMARRLMERSARSFAKRVAGMGSLRAPAAQAVQP